ncbi:hypothetical protein [Nocardiopsis lucentensis]|uniref:hypothetical protein n=1 Tax=Nocardiopsis lucentensis TaxID=53441 RepID=UPI00034AF0CF|nr:hypothetical protein [Nocardiopsis lucentensis]
MDEDIDIPENVGGDVTFTPDPLYKGEGEEVRINGQIVGRIRRMSSGAYTGTAGSVSVVGGLYNPGGGAPSRKPTRSDAITLVLEQARENLRYEAKCRREGTGY